MKQTCVSAIERQSGPPSFFAINSDQNKKERNNTRENLQTSLFIPTFSLSGIEWLFLLSSAAAIVFPRKEEYYKKWVFSLSFLRKQVRLFVFSFVLCSLLLQGILHSSSPPSLTIYTLRHRRTEGARKNHFEMS